MAAMIRTIRGNIDPAELGPCDAHEHLFLVTPAQPGEEYSDVSKAIEEAKTLWAAGGRALVDWTPIGLGRDLNGLRAVSEATGLHIVAATGVHRDGRTGRAASTRAGSALAVRCSGLLHPFNADGGGSAPSNYRTELALLKLRS